MANESIAEVGHKNVRKSTTFEVTPHEFTRKVAGKNRSFVIIDTVGLNDNSGKYNNQKILRMIEAKICDYMDDTSQIRFIITDSLSNDKQSVPENINKYA